MSETTVVGGILFCTLVNDVGLCSLYLTDFAPEVSDNIAQDKLKSLFLVDRQIDALMAFLMMLTDARYEHLLPSGL